jgi:RNA polymerase sigma factor (sigma-70 family)
MQELDDNALWREYVERGSDEAFAALVTRHVHKVYSVALRHTGNPHSAGEITQAVFVILARKSRHLGRRVILSGWLYQTARLTAVTFIRSEIRRARREQEAQMQTALNENESALWTQIAPLLDAAMAGLNETDRAAVVLRFFDGKSMAEIGAALGANETAAKKRVNRALEKLRKYFSKRGVTSTAETLAGTISANSVQAAPVALAKTATTVALAKGAAASTSTLTLIKGALKIMAWTKMKMVIVVGVVVLLAAGTTTVAVKKLSAPFDPWENWDSFNAEYQEAFKNYMAIENNIASKTWTKIDNGNAKASAAEQNKQKEFQNKIDDIFRRYGRKAPAGVTIRQTHFSGLETGSLRQGNNLIMERLDPFSRLLAVAYEKPDAYEFSLERMILPASMPSGNFDFLVNVPDHGLEHFQDQIKKQFGLVAHVETLDTNVLVLRVKNPAAPGLQPNAQPGIVGQGFFGSTALAKDLEQEFFDRPVVDETKLTEINHVFSVPFKLVDLNSLKMFLLDEYGLELVPTNMPIEMLVVEKVK